MEDLVNMNHLLNEKILTLLWMLCSLVILRMSVLVAGELLNRFANPGMLCLWNPVCNSKDLSLVKGRREIPAM